MEKLHMEFKWTVSRGRDTYGYNICSLYVNGIKSASCNGGGYDMQGTSFGEFLAKRYQDRLIKLAESNRDKLSLWHETKKETISQPEKRAHELYGMSVYVKGDDNHISRVHLDGACGMSSMERIAKMIGLELESLPSRGRSRGGQYLLMDNEAS